MSSSFKSNKKSDFTKISSTQCRPKLMKLANIFESGEIPKIYAKEIQ